MFWWGFINLLSLSSSSFVTKWENGMCRIASSFSSFKRAIKTIVDHRTKIWGKPFKNHRVEKSLLIFSKDSY